MSPLDSGAYGRVFADVYDDWYHDITDVDATVAALAELAAGGAVLELGIGTGRIALPLSQHAPVDGVDTSPEMLAVLESKPGAARVGARLGDMTALALEGPYTLVFVAFNTLFNLPDDAAQARCLGEVRRVLAPGGHLVIEAAVPAVVADDRPIHHDERRDDGAGGTIWTITTHEPATRTIHGVHVHRRGDGTTVDRPWRIHYLAPPLLDAMCEAAGLALASRWSDWSGTPWQPDDDRHVSVYRLARPLDPATGPHAP